jgi:predicted transcriptional regulator
MTEFFLGLVTGYLFTWPAIAILIALGIMFESASSHATAAFLGIVAAVSAYFTSSLISNQW